MRQLFCLWKRATLLPEGALFLGRNVLWFLNRNIILGIRNKSRVKKEHKKSSQSIDDRSLFQWKSIDHKELLAADHNTVQTYCNWQNAKQLKALPLTINSKQIQWIVYYRNWWHCSHLTSVIELFSTY